MTPEEKTQIVCETIRIVYDNWQEAGSFGKLVERLRDELGLHEVKGLYQMIHESGGLSINNRLAEDPYHE